MNIVKKERANGNVESTKGEFYRSPDVDIYENENEYIMIFDLPGVEKSDIEIKSEKDILTLTAECSKKVGEEYSCLYDEMNYSGFKRSFDMGDSVNSDDIKAEYENGTLRLVLPKREERKTKQIKINVN